jgi:hypothetical protein
MNISVSQKVGLTCIDYPSGCCGRRSKNIFLFGDVHDPHLRSITCYYLKPSVSRKKLLTPLRKMKFTLRLMGYRVRISTGHEGGPIAVLVTYLAGLAMIY